MQKKWKIHKSACLICVIGLLIYCGPKGDKVERYMQEGTEVVLNHSEPYSLEGEKAVYFEEILTIDTEKDDTAGMGLTDISHMDVDSEGNIFIANQKAQEKCIYKLDKDGGFIAAFGNKGQGPENFRSWSSLRSPDKMRLLLPAEIKSSCSVIPVNS